MNGENFNWVKWKSEEGEGLPNKLFLIDSRWLYLSFSKMNARCIRRIKFQLSCYIKIKWPLQQLGYLKRLLIFIRVCVNLPSKSKRPQTGHTISKVLIFHFQVQSDKGPQDEAGAGVPIREAGYLRLLSHHVEMSYRTQSSLSCKPNYYHMASTVLQLQSFRETASRRFQERNTGLDKVYKWFSLTIIYH